MRPEAAIISYILYLYDQGNHIFIREKLKLKLCLWQPCFDSSAFLWELKIVSCDKNYSQMCLGVLSSHWKGKKTCIKNHIVKGVKLYGY